jgi:hypothetical protein
VRIRAREARRPARESLVQLSGSRPKDASALAEHQPDDSGARGRVGGGDPDLDL